MARFLNSPLLALVFLAVAGCGGGGTDDGSEPPPPPVAITKAEAFQFLNQATFGATEDEADAVIRLRFG